MPLHYLAPAPAGFPPPEQALTEPNGLLAAGGALTPDWLLAAYTRGIFPWFNDDREPVLWWSPDPRAVLLPGTLRSSRRLARRIRNAPFAFSFDRCFGEVVAGCAAPRRDGAGRHDGTGTWITPRMQAAYGRLHQLGYAHSVEVWQHGALAGGLYGVSLGTMFFAESMFTRARDASKAALHTLDRQLERWSFSLLDCQIMNDHLRSLGVIAMDRGAFLARIEANDLQRTRRGPWRLDADLAGATDAG